MIKTSPNKWLTCFDIKPAAYFNLICFPFGGAGASVYKAWAEMLPDTVQLWAVQLPGRENRFSEAFATNPAQMIAAVIEEIALLKLTNLVVFGHSMGAHFALSATQLLEPNTTVNLLVVSGNRPPCIPYVHRWSKESDDVLMKQVLGFGGIPPEVADNQDFLTLYLQKIRADYGLYEAMPTMNAQSMGIPMKVIYGDSDPLLVGTDMQQWKAYSSVAVELTEVEGDHFYFQPNAEPLVARICAGLV